VTLFVSDRVYRAIDLLVQCAAASGQSAVELLDDLERWLPRLREKVALALQTEMNGSDWLIRDLLLGITRPSFRRLFDTEPDQSPGIVMGSPDVKGLAKESIVCSYTD
jgi:hypothetical protein